MCEKSRQHEYRENVENKGKMKSSEPVVDVAGDITTSTSRRIVVVSTEGIALESTNTVRARRHVLDANRIRTDVSNTPTVLDIVGGADSEGADAGGVEEITRTTRRGETFSSDTFCRSGVRNRAHEPSRSTANRGKSSADAREGKSSRGTKGLK